MSGEGASSIFIIDENTGDIHATKRLDREEQAYYTLRAQALDRLTNKPVEPESEFVIKIQDINDNEPKFLDGPYTAGVPEMSPVGKCKMHPCCRGEMCSSCLSNHFIRLYCIPLSCLIIYEAPATVRCLETELEVAGLEQAFALPKML